MPSDRQHQIQESRYQFPYHYIPSCEDGKFVQARVLSWGYEYLAYTRFVLSKIRALRFDSLLDAGCGDGRFLFELRKMFPDKKLAGIDISETAIRYAEALSPDVTYLCGNVRNSAELQRDFDIITAIEVFEHIPPDGLPGFVKALAERLKCNGVLALTVPSKNTPMARKHYQHFDLESLRETLKPHFAVAEHFFINRISRWVKWMECLLVNRFFILNHQGLLNRLYRSYERLWLNAEQHNAKRICALCRKCEDMGKQ